MRAFSDNFTHGGQTQLHKCHMIKSIIVNWDGSTVISNHVFYDEYISNRTDFLIFFFLKKAFQTLVITIAGFLFFCCKEFRRINRWMCQKRRNQQLKNSRTKNMTSGKSKYLIQHIQNVLRFINPNFFRKYEFFFLRGSVYHKTS